MFREYETFALTQELPGIPDGTVGVVLMVFGGTPCSYEVEFPDGQGSNLGDQITYTVTENYMKHM